MRRTINNESAQLQNAITQGKKRNIMADKRQAAKKRRAAVRMLSKQLKSGRFDRLYNELNDSHSAILSVAADLPNMFDIVPITDGSKPGFYRLIVKPEALSY